MDIHNYPIDSAETATDARDSAGLREQTSHPGRRPLEHEQAGRRPGGWAWVCGILLAGPLIVGSAWFLLAWLVFHG